MTRTNRRTFCLGVAGGTIAFAGCAGSLGGSDEGGSGTGDRGTVNFYISDEPNRIDDFEYLNVTVSSVSFKASDDGNGEDEESEVGEDPDGDGEGDASEADNAEADDADDGAGDDSESVDDDDSDRDDVEGDRGGWLEYDLDDPTVDLTKLQGPKATMLDELDVPAGDYEAADLHVADIEAVLIEDLGGGETELKIPSETLKLRTSFTVEAGDELDFVYDIAPHKAGNSGKYILTPVISESGTDAEIEAVDATVEDETD